MVKAAVWEIGEWLTSKYPNAKDNKYYQNKVIVFKGVSEFEGKEYRLNLNQADPGNVDKWEKHIKEGVVFELPLMAKGSGYVQNDNTVNKFGQFRIIK